MRRFQSLVLTLSFLIQVSLAVGLTGWFSIKKGEELISENTIKIHQNLNYQIERRLDNFLSIPYIINQILFDEIDAKKVDLGDKVAIRKNLRQFIESLKSTPVDTVEYGDEKGNYVGVTRMNDGSIVVKVTRNKDLYIYSSNQSNQDSKLLNIEPNYDPRNRPWYQAAIKQKQITWSPIDIKFVNQSPGITLARPIYNNQGQIMGVLGTSLLLKDLNNFLKNIKIGKTGKILIVEKNGEIIASSDSKLFDFDDYTKIIFRLNIKDIDPELLRESNLEKNNRNVFSILGLNSNKRFIQVVPLQEQKGLNWLLITVLYREEFQDIYQQNLEKTIIFCSLVLLISSFIALLDNFLVVRPILNLVDLKRDRLTGLLSRSFLVEKIDAILKKQQNFSLLFLSFERFKRINNILGNSLGDKLLIAVARKLKIQLGNSKIIARIEGDEFAIIIPHQTTVEQAIELAKQIQQELSPAFIISHNKVFLSSKFGIVLSNNNYIEPEHILRDANTAMIIAQKDKNNFYQVFDATMHERAIALWKLESELQAAIENQELTVHYQPIVDLGTRKIIGLEALARWQHPTKGFISPVEFIPIAEETGIIRELGLYILRMACHDFSQWKLPISLSVNLSARQIEQPDLIIKIDEVIAITKMDRTHLKFEVTESTIIENANSAQEFLKQLIERSIQLSIDDFGTGYSSLSYLHEFSFQTLKIDRAFVNIEGMRMAKSIINLAHELEMEVVAEGIETEQQRSQLIQLGCEYGQGYLFSRPLDRLKIEALLTL